MPVTSHADGSSSQIESAVEIAWNPASGQDIKAQAFDFLNQIRSDPQGWQACTTLFVRTPRASEVVRLVGLEVVNFAVHTQQLDRPSLALLKDTLLQYVQQTYGNNQGEQVDPPHLQNKLSQTLTYLFVFLYKDGWESFIDDFSNLTRLPGSSQRDNVAGVILYLRILASIHDEIADMLLTQQTSDAKRNTELKDHLRLRDVQKIADSWKELLALYGGGQNDVVVEMILKVIGKWVSWVDISLVASQDMLSLLLPVVGRSDPTGSEDKVRGAAIDTLTEIVGKGMKHADKMEMISFLNLREIVAQLVASAPLNEWKGTSRYDTDLAEGVGKLVNTVMSDIVEVLQECPPGDETRTRADQHLQDFLPFLLRFFSDDYDEICSIVIPSLTDLLTAIRKMVNVSSAYSDILPPILNAIILKMRYDETSQWGNEDEQTDEAEFQELRKRLQNLQKTVAAANQDLYIDVLSNLVANTFQNLGQRGSQMDWRDLDLALHEMYLFGELALPNQGLGSKNAPSTIASERLVVMMQKMVESGECFLCAAIYMY